MADIFLSHAGKDESIAREIKNQLNARGITVYMFQDHPEPGREIREKLKQEIRNSTAVVALFTKNFFKSNSTLPEIGIAHDAGKQIFGFVEKDVEDKVQAFPFVSEEYVPFDSKEGLSIADKAKNHIEKHVKNKSKVAATKEKENNKDSVSFSEVVFLIGIGIALGYMFGED